MGRWPAESSVWQRILLGSIPFAILAGTWVTLVHGLKVGPVFLPSPENMPSVLGRMFFPVRTAAEMASNDSLAGFFFRPGSIVWDIGLSAWRVGAGFLLAVVLATPLGVLMGYSKSMHWMFSPIIGFIRYMPVPVFIPLCMLWFGTGDLEKIVIIFAGAFFQLVLMVADAAALVRRDYYEAATMLGAPREDLILRVLVPAAMPQIYDSYRVCLGWAWTYLVAAEIVGATSGIGYYIIKAQRYLMVPQIFAAMVIIGCLGMTTDFILGRLHRVFFPWIDKQTDHE